MSLGRARRQGKKCEKIMKGCAAGELLSGGVRKWRHQTAQPKCLQPRAEKRLPW